MYQVIYTSVAVDPMTVSGLAELLVQARDKNEQIEVTGLLLYKNGSFMQAFEGEEEVVCQLFDTIKADERHQGLITLSQESIEERHFPDWSMGFKHLGDMDHSEWPEGFADIMSEDFDPDDFDAQPSYARDALLGFKSASL